MKIYLLRHGQTVMNKETRIQGRIDTPLSDTGIKQAESIAAVIADAGIVFSHIFSSPLRRAKKTCEVVTGRPESDFIIDERLIEMDFGELEGHPYRELTIDKRALFTAPENYEPDSGETIQELIDRTGDFLESLKGLPDNSTVLVASHGAAIHAMLSYIKHKEQRDFWDESVHNCDTIEVELRDGIFSCTGNTFIIPDTLKFDYLWTRED